jgi:hypothetical protein
MSDYNQRVKALARFGMGACDRLAEKHKELFLSIPVEDAFEKIVAVTRMDDTIEPPKNEDEAYAIMESILAELLFDGRLKVPTYGLGPNGRESFDFLVDLYQNGRIVPSTDPKEIYKDVVAQYRTNMAEFQHRRATDPDFLRRSNEANTLKLL